MSKFGHNLRMKGHISQRRSRTAILGYLAAAWAGRKFRNRPETVAWLAEHGLALNEGGLRDALKDRDGPRSDPADDPMEENWVRDALDFDATKLNLSLAVILFPSPEHPDSLHQKLRSTERAVRIYRAYESGVVAVLVFDGPQERLRLRTVLEEVEPDLRWLEIREVDDAQAADTWLSLARKIAETEGLNS